MADGQLGVNLEATSPGVFFKNSAGNLVKVGPVHVGTTAPNVSPAGQSGNSTGEQWLDTTGGTYNLKIWDGSAWRSEAGEFVNVTGDTMTGALAIIAGSASAPGLAISGDSNTGIYSPGADQLALTTGGTQRLTTDTAAVTSTLPVVHPLGAAATPSITFTGDLNTGIYSPGADQLAISTGGTGRITIDGSGNINIDSNTLYVDATNNRVGIGTASPSDTLHVAGGARFGANDASTAYLEIGAGATGNRSAFIDLTGDTTYSDFGLRISRGNSGADTNSELRHRGIGGLILNAADSGSVSFRTSDTERARLDSSGRLLVGTSSTSALVRAAFQANSGNSFGAGVVHLQRGEAAATITVDEILGALRGTDNADSVGAEITFSADAAWGAGDYPGRLVFSTTADGAASPTERMRITSGGNVGIGTTSPQVSLDVAGNVRVRNGNGFQWIGESAATDTKIWDAYTDNTSANTLRFRCINDAFSSSNTWLQVNRTGAEPTAVIFSTGTSEKVRIDSSGRLLVGTSSYITGNSYSIGQLLNVAGSSGQGIQVQTFSNDQFAAAIDFFKSRSATVGTRTIPNDGDALGNIIYNAWDGATVRQAASIIAFVDGTPGANDMPGRIVLSTTLDGASTPTERFRITNDGVIAHDQPAPAAVNATATLTIANLKAGIITSTSAAATDMTLPTGTDTQAGFSGTYDNFTFEWSVINTGPSLVRVLAGTAHTVVGSGSVLTGTSGRFASRRTAANTFVTYRLV
jgi:hypothetical protein